MALLPPMPAGHMENPDFFLGEAVTRCCYTLYEGGIRESQVGSQDFNPWLEMSPQNFITCTKQ